METIHMGYFARCGCYLGTGVAWAASITCAIARVEIRYYLLVLLATLVLSVATVLILLARPDHGLLADARIQLRAMQAEAALAELERDLEREKARLHNPGEDRVS